jgi:hypothetical protein
MLTWTHLPRAQQFDERRDLCDPVAIEAALLEAREAAAFLESSVVQAERAPGGEGQFRLTVDSAHTEQSGKLGPGLKLADEVTELDLGLKRERRNRKKAGDEGE